MKTIPIMLASTFVLAALQQAEAQYWTTPAPVKLPSIRSATYNITSYGASTGSANNATAIQNAINAAYAAGGGTVQVPSGTFLSGPFHLTNNINLNLASGSTLKMLAKASWPSATTPLITSSHATNLEVTGSGTIDGQGAAWWAAFATNSSISRPQEMSLGSG